jgi:hypothetical protein
VKEPLSEAHLPNNPPPIDVNPDEAEEKTQKAGYCGRAIFILNNFDYINFIWYLNSYTSAYFSPRFDNFILTDMKNSLVKVFFYVN